MSRDKQTHPKQHVCVCVWEARLERVGLVVVVAMQLATICARGGHELRRVRARLVLRRGLCRHGCSNQALRQIPGRDTIKSS